MSNRRGLLGASVLLVMMLVGADAWAVEFEPFSDVENVCPDCKQPAADTLTLDSGEEIRGEVVSDNDDFYIVVRYGEVRAIPHDRITGVTWADGNRPSDLDGQDQIVLANGHVLTGTIVDENETPGFYQLQSSFNDQSYVVFKGELTALYRNGQRTEAETVEEDDSSETTTE